MPYGRRFRYDDLNIRRLKPAATKEFASTEGGCGVLWKIQGKGLNKLEDTTFEKESLLEENLENWIEANPSVLGERLLIIGRQVEIPDVKDTLDLLALDTKGNAVIIELKRGQLKDLVEMQSLKYASYISRWDYDDFERQTKEYYKDKLKEGEFDFNELFEGFCENVGIEEIPDINGDQRIILVGSDIRSKLGSVALWLLEHHIDIKVIEVHSYKEGESVFLNPQVIIPPPTTEEYEIGKLGIRKDKPWLDDGKTWHLNKRCSEETSLRLQRLIGLIKDNLGIEPSWDQKFYISFKKDNRIWLYVNTRKSLFTLNARVKPNAFNLEELSSRLKVKPYSEEADLAESYLWISIRGDWVGISVKKEFDLENPELIKFLRESCDSF